jgi:WD40 repeat protein/serine/threonine protein kinase
MAKTSKDITLILAEALEKPTAQERAAYLDSVCGDDTHARDEVESLLQQERTVGDFLDATVHELDISADSLSVMEGPGTIIDRYQLLERIGEGGMAVVYMAQQDQPIRRNIAFKIIKLGMDTQQVITRFEAERQALALMDHPNIAKVLDAGCTETGRPYFVMELVNGVPITRYCDKNKLSTRKRLKLFMQVCQAIQHAHQKRIIHRDIKPSNILVTFHENNPVPKVIDFGIAKATEDQLTEKPLNTKLQTFVGTPAYMSPEQAQMGDVDIDTRTDIYSLGVVLYELLTSQTPFDTKEFLKKGLDQYHQVIREREPERPSTRVATMLPSDAKVIAECHQLESGRLVRMLRADLDWIVMKCLEKDRRRRYETASGLAMDIQRYLNGEAVLARSPSMAYRTWKFTCRYKAIVAAVLILAIGVVVSSWQAVRATRAELEQNRLRSVAQAAQEEEAAQRQQAEKEGLATLRQAYNSDMNLTQQALLTHNYGRVAELLDRHRPRPNRPDFRQWEWRYFWNQSRSEATFAFAPHAHAVMNASICAQGRHLISIDREGTLNLWDLSERSLVMTLSEPGLNTRSLVFSRDGTRFALAIRQENQQSLVKVWAVATQQVVSEFAYDHRIRSLSFTPSDTALRILDRNLAVHTWDLAEQKLQMLYPGVPQDAQEYRKASFSPDGQYLALSRRSGGIRLFDVRARTEIAQMDVFEGDIASLVFSPDGQYLAVSPLYTGISTDIKLFSTDTGQEHVTLAGHVSWVPALVFTPDSKRIVSAGADQTIRIWDVASGQELTRLHGHRSEIFCVAVSPDGKRIVSGCKDGTLFGWDIEQIGHQTPFETLPLEIRSLDFLSQSQGILTVNTNGTVTVWDSATLQETESLDALGGEVNQLLISADETRIVASTRNGDLKILDWATRQVIKEGVWNPEHRGPVELVGLVDQGRIVVMMGADDKACLFDTVEWQPKAVWDVPRARSRWVSSPVLSPDEHFLLSVGADATINFTDLRNGETEAIATGQDWGVLDMAFLPNNRMLATSSGEGTVSLWDMASRDVIAVLRGHLLGVHAVAISPDGQRLVSGSKGNEAVKLWDINTRHEVATLAGEGLLSRHLKFAPDGRLLGAINTKDKAHIWRAPSLQEIARAEENKDRDQMHPKNIKSQGSGP